MLAANRQAVLSYIDAQRKLMAAGQISPLALEQILAGQAARDKQLDLARKEGVECRATLAALLKRDSNMPFPTLAAAFPNMDQLSSLAAALRETPLVEGALRNRPDLQALGQYVSGARERLTAARNERDPKINLLLDPNGFFVDFTWPASTAIPNMGRRRAPPPRSPMPASTSPSSRIRSGVTSPRAWRPCAVPWRRWPIAAARRKHCRRWFRMRSMPFRRGAWTGRRCATWKTSAPTPPSSWLRRAWIARSTWRPCVW